MNFISGKTVLLIAILQYFIIQSDLVFAETTKRVLIATQKSVLDLTFSDENWSSKIENARLVYDSKSSSLLLGVSASPPKPPGQSVEVLFAQSNSSNSKIYSAKYDDFQDRIEIANGTLSNTIVNGVAYDWSANILYIAERASQGSRIRAVNMKTRSNFQSFQNLRPVLAAKRGAVIANMAIDVSRRVLYYMEYEERPDMVALHEVVFCTIKRLNLPSAWSSSSCGSSNYPAQSETVAEFKCEGSTSKIWLSEEYIYFNCNLDSIKRLPRMIEFPLNSDIHEEEYLQFPRRDPSRKNYPLLFYSFAILDENKKDVLVASLNFSGNSSSLMRCKTKTGNMTCHVIESVVLRGQQETPLCSFGYIMSMSLVPENNQSLEPTDLNSEMDVARIRDVIIEENSTAPSITWSTSGNLSPDFGQFRVTIFHKNKKSQEFVVKTPQFNMSEFAIDCCISSLRIRYELVCEEVSTDFGSPYNLSLNCSKHCRNSDINIEANQPIESPDSTVHNLRRLSLTVDHLVASKEHDIVDTDTISTSIESSSSGPPSSQSDFTEYELFQDDVENKSNERLSEPLKSFQRHGSENEREESVGSPNSEYGDQIRQKKSMISGGKAFLKSSEESSFDIRLQEPRNLGYFHMYMVAFIGLLIVSAVLCFAVGCARDHINKFRKPKPYFLPSINLLDIRSEHFMQSSNSEASLSHLYGTGNWTINASSTDRFSEFDSNQFGSSITHPRFLDLSNSCNNCTMGSKDSLNTPIQIPVFCPGTSQDSSSQEGGSQTNPNYQKLT